MDEQANERVIREAYDAYMRGDIEQVLARMTSDIVWIVAGGPEIPVAGERHGVAEVQDFFKLVSELQEAQGFAPHEFLAVRDKVIVLGRYRWLIKATNRIAESDFVHVFTMRDGQAAQYQEFYDTQAWAEAYRPMFAEAR